MRFIFLVTTILVVSEFVESQPSLTITPKSDYVAALHQSVTEFTCTATNGTILRWNLDYGTVIDSGENVTNRGVTTTPAAELQLGSGVIVSILSISATQQNSRTVIICQTSKFITTENPLAEFVGIFFMFQVQGILGAPPNTMLSEVNDQFVRILSWDPPFTLNITDIEPDILYYQICYNITMDDLVCLNVSSRDRREFRFLNIRDSLLFTVTAFNVVGRGEFSEIVYKPSRCDNVIGLRS